MWTDGDGNEDRRMPIRRTLFAAAAVAVTVGVTPAVLPFATPALNGRTCQEKANSTVRQCSTDRLGETRWAKTDIAIVRQRQGSGARIGTLMSLPGGPGSSGVDEIMQGGKFSADLEGRFDIVSLDPRG